MKRSAPNAFSASAPLLLLGLVLLGATASVRAQDAAQPPSTQPVLPDTEIRALVDYAEMFRLCEMFDLAHVFYDAALERTRTLPPDAPFRLEIEARYIVYTFRVGAPQWRQNLIGETLPRLAHSEEAPLLQHWRYRIEAWQARTRRDWPRFHEFVEKALLQTPATPKPLLYKAETVRLKAEGYYDAGQNDEAIRLAESALKFHSLAREALYQTDVHRLIALCHEADGKTTARNISRRRVVNTVSDFAQGPLLDLERVVAEIDQVRESQRLFAERAEYVKAIHATVTLLNLKKARSEGKVGEIPLLNQDNLLASAALYMRRCGHAEAGEVMFEQAQIAAVKQIAPLEKARYRYDAARYLRVAGKARAALDSLTTADRILERIGHNDIRFSIAILEERGLVLLAMAQPAAAAHAFEDAQTKAETAGLTESVERYKRFLTEIAKGNTNPDALTMPPAESPEEARRTTRIAMRTSGPSLFQSPFMTDHPDEKPRSAAQAAMGKKLTRPLPSPTPLRMTGDDLMGSSQFRRAIKAYKSEIDREGESIERLQNLGQCHYQIGQLSEARRVFQQVLKIDPQNTKARGYINVIDEQLKPRKP